VSSFLTAIRLRPNRTGRPAAFVVNLITGY